MNENFKAFIDSARVIASNEGVKWDIPLDDEGIALKDHAWNLRALSKDGRPTSPQLRTFSEFEGARNELIARGLLPDTGRQIRPVSSDWQDLIKAHTLDHIVVKKKSVTFAASAATAWRLLATVAQRSPWLVTADDVRFSCEIADTCLGSNERTIIIMALIRNFVDPLHLFDACPLAALAHRPVKAKNRRAKFANAEQALAKKLNERRSQEKLPDQKAFWELMKIVYTETPLSVTDALRFAMIKLMVLTGLRIGEVVFLPLDWKRTRGYVDYSGRPAGDSGGISESLSIRHFAEKMGEEFLFEETQFVPDMFREEIESIFADVIQLTAPLRATLKAQFESGRLFPQYAPDHLVDALQMYVHLTGNPVWTAPPYSAELTQILADFKKSFDLELLAKISDVQEQSKPIAYAVLMYFHRNKQLLLRDADGDEVDVRSPKGRFILVSDAEAFVRKYVPTKQSDLAPLRLNNGSQLAPWEMLFLMPKRAVGQGRGDSVIDLVNTFSVGIADQIVLMKALGGDKVSDQYTLFKAYGKTPEDKALTLISHSFRHLQNTELFRLGVSDAVISKRFNRRSAAQSYVYDHRSLAEHLDTVELPDEWALVLGESKSQTVAKMILAGKASGPLVREFKRIQLEEGDDSALQFLMAEADGFHVTPYGTCLNSFTVDPCPKSLECFNDCRHLSATDLPEHRENLVVLLGRLKVVLEHASAKPEGTIGKANQIAHALKRVEGVERLLATPAGELVYPEGIDLSKPKFAGSILDGT